MSSSTRVLLGLIAAAVLAGATVSLLWRDQVRLDLAAAEPAGQAADPPPTTAAPTTAPTTTTSTTVPPAPTIPSEEILPPSGSGKRVVFSIERQRMWWVDDEERVLRTSLVSGRANTPTVGTFQVYSKTLNATGLDGSRMDYFVRFTKGPNGWAIGFHDIPRLNGEPVQTEEQLGQPLSHGCIRQRLEDAQFTWEFLDVGSTVVVVA